MDENGVKNATSISSSGGPSVVSVMCVPLATALFGGAVLGSTADKRNGRVHSESQDTDRHHRDIMIDAGGPS